MIPTCGHTHSQEGNKEIRQRITIKNCDSDTTPLYWEKKKLTMTVWIEVTMRKNYNNDLNLINDTGVRV